MQSCLHYMIVERIRREIGERRAMGLSGVWGEGFAPSRAVFQLEPEASRNFWWMAWLLTHLGPQNRESFQTSLKRSFHIRLRHVIEVQKPVNAGPEGEQPRPNLSNRNTQGRQRRTDDWFIHQGTLIFKQLG